MGVEQEVEELISGFGKVVSLKKQPLGPFEERCLRDPQGVIKDLLAQTKRQAKKIYKKNKEIEGLVKENSKLVKQADRVRSKKDEE